MEEINIQINLKYEEYIKVASQMGYYLRGTGIPDILKNIKCGLLAAGGGSNKIDIFSNSLEHMGTLCGHKEGIFCLSSLLFKRGLASGSKDKTVKVWDLSKKKAIYISTLSGHTKWVTALCQPRSGIIASGSDDQSVIIWNITEGKSKYVFKEHKTPIRGIVRISPYQIIVGEYLGALSIWDIDLGIRTKFIPKIDRPYDDYLAQLKIFLLPDINMTLAVCNKYSVTVWGSKAENNWESPIQEFGRFDETGYSIEQIAEDIFLRGGGYRGKLGIVNMKTVLSYSGQSMIQLHSDVIRDLLYISKNILVSASADKTLKVIDIISRKCYFIYKKVNDGIYTLTKLI